MILRQEKPKVIISNFNRPFEFRLVTLQDEAWLRDHLPEGLGSLIKSMEKNESNTFIECVWHFLDIETKKAIISTEIVYFEGGDQITCPQKDYQSKLKHLIGGEQEMAECLKALVKSFRLSMPENTGSTEKKTQVSAP